MSKIVCFLGVLGSGKDYQSKKLVSEGYVQINFADELRAVSWEILGWSPKNDEEYDQFKKGLIEIPNNGFVNGRVFLQNVGSTMRKRNRNYWAECWQIKVQEAIENGKNICVSDCRFPNEIQHALEFVRNNRWNKLYHICNEVEFIFCNYVSSRYDAINAHESEHLAQRLLNEGCKDLQVLDKRYVKGLL